MARTNGSHGLSLPYKRAPSPTTMTRRDGRRRLRWRALAAAWLKLNTAGSERLSAHFEAVSCGRPMLVRAEGTHSEALATVAIVQNVVSPSTLWQARLWGHGDGWHSLRMR